MKPSSLFGGAIAALLLASTASAATLVDGNFGGCSPGCPTNLTPLSGGSGQLYGWTIGSQAGGNADAAVELVKYDGGTGWNAYSGSHSVALSGSIEGSISQNLNTTAGKTYDVTFYVSGNPKNIGKIKTIGVETNGALQTFSFKDTSTSNSQMNWVMETYQFTATSDSTLLTLFNDHVGRTSPNPHLFGLALDDINIHQAAVPEPATWAMMILGVAGLGGVLRDRRRQTPAAA
jgi:hypothetical protein